MTQFNWSVINFAWVPILPLIVVAAGAMGVLLVGVQIDDEDSGGLGILSIALFVFAAILTLLLFGGRPSLAFSGALAVDRLHRLFRIAGPVRRRDDRVDVGRVRRRPGTGRRRVLRADTVRRARHDADGGGRRPDHDLSRPRDDVDRGLRAGRLPAPRPALQRGRAQVLPARRFFHRLPALRYRADLRRHRLDQARADRGRALASGDRQRAAAGRRRHAADRLRLQGRRRALPYVDARRLRGRADAGHGLHGGGRQGRGVRRLHAHLHGPPGAARRRSGRWCCG